MSSAQKISKNPTKEMDKMILEFNLVSLEHVPTPPRPISAILVLTIEGGFLAMESYQEAHHK